MGDGGSPMCSEIGDANGEYKVLSEKEGSPHQEKVGLLLLRFIRQRMRKLRRCCLRRMWKLHHLPKVGLHQSFFYKMK